MREGGAVRRPHRAPLNNNASDAIYATGAGNRAYANNGAANRAGANNSRASNGAYANNASEGATSSGKGRRPNRLSQSLAQTILEQPGFDR